jgi:hypothetical protein
MKHKKIFIKLFSLIALMICLQGCTGGYVNFVHEKMSSLTINLLFISSFIISIICPFLAKKYDSILLFLISGISTIIVLFLCVPFFASITDPQFLEHRTQYTSGSMNGYEFYSWGAIFFYSCLYLAILDK